MAKRAATHKSTGHAAAGEAHHKAHAAHVAKVHAAAHVMRAHKAKGVKVAVRTKHA